MKRILACIVAGGVLLAAGAGGYAVYDLWRHEMFEPAAYETAAPDLPAMPAAPRVLVFSKTNGFRHVDGIPAANAMFRAFAEEAGWPVFFTENAAVHRADLLAGFDLLVWNNVSGDVLLGEQRDAFRGYLEGGGAVLAIHATGGDPVYPWGWHPREFIRAQFIGHPLLPQFQTAAVTIEQPEHPAMKHLPAAWRFEDEWYSFAASPRGRATVLASLDESSYRPALAGPVGSLRMGDHPIVWHHTVGRGTVFYSAIGHRAEAYGDAHYRELLRQACLWLIARRTPVAAAG